MKNAIKQLNHIQQNMKAPKDRMNDFGGFAYRNAEDILQAMKPHMADFIVLTNYESICVEGWHYVKATTQLTDGEHSVYATALAREPLAKKGMDDSMITGSAQSYAQKYSLAALCAISGESDADEANNWTAEAEAYHELVKAAQAAPESDRDVECINLFMYTDGLEPDSKVALFGTYMDMYSMKGKKGKLKEAIKRLNDYGQEVLNGYVSDLMANADKEQTVAALRADLSDEQLEYVDAVIEIKLATGE